VTDRHPEEFTRRYASFPVESFSLGTLTEPTHSRLRYPSVRPTVDWPAYRKTHRWTHKQSNFVLWPCYFRL